MNAKAAKHPAQFTGHRDHSKLGLFLASLLAFAIGMLVFRSAQ